MTMLNRVNEVAAQIEQLTGYSFTNKLLCAEAVQMAGPHNSIIYQSGIKTLGNNKRLAVMGDAVLEKVLCEKWFRATNERGNPLSLADWTVIRKTLRSNEALAQRGLIFNIDKYIITNQGILASPGMVATTMEAIIGAVFIDGGDSAVLNVMEYLGFFNHPYITIPQAVLEETPLISLIKRGRLVLLLAAFGASHQGLNAGSRHFPGDCALV